MAAVNHLLAGKEEQLPERFLHQELRARQAFALVVSSPEAARFRDDLSFFQAVAIEYRRAMSDSAEGTFGRIEVETALCQVVSEAVVASGAIDIYAAVGMARPDISLIDEDFARRAAKSPYPNLQIELLRRLLAEEVRKVTRRNVAAEKRFSEMLERATKAYNNPSLTAAEAIAELVELRQAIAS
jgi:type I restriction enzyme R subunit